MLSGRDKMSGFRDELHDFGDELQGFMDGLQEIINELRLVKGPVMGDLKKTGLTLDRRTIPEPVFQPGFIFRRKQIIGRAGFRRKEIFAGVFKIPGISVA